MTNSKHTPGPWTVKARLDSAGHTMPHINLVSPDGVIVAYNLFVRDAGLLAEAPAMYEILQNLHALNRTDLEPYKSEAMAILDRINATDIP